MCEKVIKFHITFQGIFVYNFLTYGLIYKFLLFTLVNFYIANILTGFILFFTLDSSFLDMVMNSGTGSFGGGSGGSSGGNPNPGPNPSGLEFLGDNHNNKDKNNTIYEEIAD
ncbi:hypothetical protein GCM10023339_13770 [Alloalcanivorax gelatiniphagus]